MTIYGPVSQNPLQMFVTLEIWTLRPDCVQVFQAPLSSSLAVADLLLVLRTVQLSQLKK